MALRVASIRRAAFAVCALAPLLAACSAADGIGEKLLLGGTKPQEMDPKLYAETPVCPNVEIRDGTEFMPIFEAGKFGNIDFIRYQANIQRVARDCTEDPAGLHVRVGAAGRVLSGPKGATGSVTVPVRIVALVGDRVIYSKLFPTTVDIQAPDYSALWSVIDSDITLTVADSHDVTIYVGLDGKGEIGKPAKPTKARKPVTKG
jgi:hypothetical protein